MPDELPNTLARCVSKGYVIAPAGYGKTHLIALAVKAGSNRQLILTHTFAGVNSIKSKMTYLGVPSSRYQVDTIASWSFACVWHILKLRDGRSRTQRKQWNKLYESCRDLLGKEFIRHVVASTYSGVYVDEYQDCSDLQHTLVCALADFLPVGFWVIPCRLSSILLINLWTGMPVFIHILNAWGNWKHLGVGTMQEPMNLVLG